MKANAENKKKVINRLSRLEGQIRGVRRMIEEGDDCEKIVTQLSAVHSALEGATKLAMAEFFTICLSESVEKGESQDQAVERFVSLLLNTKI